MHSGSCCSGGGEDETIPAVYVPRVVKVVVLGNANVGKTTLINRVANRGDLEHSSVLTITTAYVNTILSGVECNIWDTAGQERYRSLAPIYLRSSHICIMAYSVVDLESYQDMQVWEDLIDRHSPGAKKLIVATKVDLADAPPVKEGEQRPDAVVSSVTGDGVEELRELIGFMAGRISGHYII